MSYFYTSRDPHNCHQAAKNMFVQRSISSAVCMVVRLQDHIDKGNQLVSTEGILTWSIASDL
jgi:hypothetical protein